MIPTPIVLGIDPGYHTGIGVWPLRPVGKARKEKP